MSTLAQRNASALSRAQYRFDNATPPTGASECEECRGRGFILAAEDDEDDTCPHCEGARFTDDAGNPVWGIE